MNTVRHADLVLLQKLSLYQKGAFFMYFKIVPQIPILLLYENPMVKLNHFVVFQLLDLDLRSNQSSSFFLNRKPRLSKGKKKKMRNHK